MSARESKELQWLFLVDAVGLFEATADEIREACEAGKIRGVYYSSNDTSALRVCLDDMRKCFRESASPEEADKRSHWGKLAVAAGTAGGYVASQAGNLVTNESLMEVWNFLSEHVFHRSLPSAGDSKSEPNATPEQPRTGSGVRISTSSTGRTTRVASGYTTRIGGGSTRSGPQRGGSSPPSGGGSGPRGNPFGGGGNSGYKTR